MTPASTWKLVLLGVLISAVLSGWLFMFRESLGVSDGTERSPLGPVCMDSKLTCNFTKDLWPRKLLASQPSRARHAAISTRHDQQQFHDTHYLRIRRV